MNTLPHGTGRGVAQSPRQGGGYLRTLIAALLVAVLGTLWALIGYWAWSSRADSLAAAANGSTNLAHSLAALADSLFRTADARLDVLEQMDRHGLLTQAPNKVGSSVLVQMVQSSPLIHSGHIFGPDGNVVVGAIVLPDGNVIAPPSDLNVSDREYFRHFSGNSCGSRPQSVFLGETVTGRVTGTRFVPVAMARCGADGRFQGIYLVSIRLETFQSLFSTFHLSPSQHLTLFRYDGSILVNIPLPEAIPPHMEEVFSFPTDRMVPDKGGVLSYTQDDRRFMLAYRVLGRLPLAITVGQAEEDILAGWRRQAATLILAGSLATGLLLVFAAWLTRLARKVEDNERTLQDQVASRTADLARTAASLAEAQRIAHLGDWIWILATGEVRWSDETYRIFGKDPLTFRPNFRDVMSLIHPDDRSLIETTIDGIMASNTETTYSVKFRVPLEDGGMRVCHCQGELGRDASGTPLSLTGVVLDITERERDALALERKANMLERSNAELQQFAYVASHDLQEPLNLISGYAALFADTYSGRMGAQGDEFIRSILEGVGRMKTLIRDVLEYSRVTTSGAPYTPTDFEDVLREAQTNLGHQITASGAIIEHGVLPILTVDRSQMVRLFQNLLGNALKYRRSDVRLHLEITAEDQGDTWLIRVTDNGIGIDPRHLEQIFLIFQRLHGKDQYDGTGIGLALCKKIAQRHGGTIWAESVLGQGSTFLFTLPAHPEETEPQQDTVGSNSPPRSR